jgi:N-acetylneuraminate synthase/N,N'-diacetyllegionaminate synthase
MAAALTDFASSFAIAGRSIGGDAPCYVIAEAGVSHFGSLHKAHALVDLAVSAKADAVKFQHFHSDRLVGESSPEWRRRLHSRQLSDADVLRVAEYSRKRGITFICTAHEETALDFLDNEIGVPAFKIGSGEVENWPYIANIARRGKPVILSTGMYTLDLIDIALKVLDENGCHEAAILHCVTAYPADPGTINLDAMRQISTLFRGPVGYSDHTAGTAVALAAVARGAKVIEKHIALDFNVPDAQDWKVSCGPADLEKFVADVRAVESALGGEPRRLSEMEQQSILWARKSLTAARDIARGEKIDAGMLLSQRPGDGLPPSQLATVVGLRAREAIPRGTKIRLSMLDPG